jgi:hypothetical protein
LRRVDHDQLLINIDLGTDRGNERYQILPFALDDEQLRAPCPHDLANRSDCFTAERLNLAARELPVVELIRFKFDRLLFGDAYLAAAKLLGRLDRVAACKLEHNAPLLEPVLFDFQIKPLTVRHHGCNTFKAVEAFRKIGQNVGNDLAL